MARWVTIKPQSFPFDYRVPKTNSLLHFMSDGPGDTGERYVPDDQADFIIKRGYGVEGKRTGSITKSRKGGAPRRKSAKTAGNAKASHAGSNRKLGDANLAAADRSGNRGAVDQAAG